jgi:hypothetical protein
VCNRNRVGVLTRQRTAQQHRHLHMLTFYEGQGAAGKGLLPGGEAHDRDEAGPEITLPSRLMTREDCCGTLLSALRWKCRTTFSAVANCFRTLTCGTFGLLELHARSYRVFRMSDGIPADIARKTDW